jgi:hypothetical protein
VPVQVFAITGSSFWVGMFGAAGFVPLVVFGLWGGAAADAIDRRRLLVLSSLTLRGMHRGPARAGICSDSPTWRSSSG